MTWTPEHLIDTTRYPIIDLDSPAAQAVVASGRAALASNGLCLLPNFVAPEALAAMVAEAQALVPTAHRRSRMNGAWRYGEEDASFPPDHPRHRRHLSQHGTIGTDEFAADSPIRALYEWDGLTRFVAALTGETVLHRCADPLVSCVVTVLQDGDAHAWHYDDNDFVVSLLLQSADEGGLFEFAPNIRTDTDENYDEVARIFDGDRRRLVTAKLEPGTLSLFRGQRSLHHVTQVRGPRARMIALFSYDRRPDMIFRSSVHLQTLGRTLPPRTQQVAS